MRKKRIRGSLCLTAVVLVLTADTGRAIAYFTDYVSASGGASIVLRIPDTEIHEEVFDWTKTVTIENTGECDCYVRVRAYAGSGRTMTYTSDGGWTDGGDDSYYYELPLAPGELSAPLKIAVPRPAQEDTEDFNVIVVSEHTMVLYDADGVPDRALSWADRKEE